MRRRPNSSIRPSEPKTTTRGFKWLNRKRFWPLVSCLATVVGLGALVPAHAALGETQAPIAQVFLDDVIVREATGQVELRLRILSAYGKPIDGIQAGDLNIRDSGQIVEAMGMTMVPKETKGAPQTAVVALDSSAVMAGEPLERAHLAIRTLLQQAGANDRLAVLGFHDDVDTLAAFDASRAEAMAGLENHEVNANASAGRLFDATHQALELARATEGLPRQTFALVISDGRDGGSERTAQDIVLLARGDAGNSPIPIFTIGYAPEDQEGFPTLKRLSKSTGAHFFRLNSTIHLPSITSAIWKQMQSGYVARFPVSLDGEVHEFVVTAGESSAKRRVRFPYREPADTRFLALAAGGGILLLGLAIFLLLWSRRKPTGRLVFKTGALAGQVVPVRKKRTRIGAVATRNDIVIDNETASRHHAVLERKGEHLEIQDLESTNGTFVNGTRVTAQTLVAGDRIRITDVDIVYEE